MMGGTMGPRPPPQRNLAEGCETVENHRFTALRRLDGPRLPHKVPRHEHSARTHFDRRRPHSVRQRRAFLRAVGGRPVRRPQPRAPRSRARSGGRRRGHGTMAAGDFPAAARSVRAARADGRLRPRTGVVGAAVLAPARERARRRAHLGDARHVDVGTPAQAAAQARRGFTGTRFRAGSSRRRPTACCSSATRRCRRAIVRPRGSCTRSTSARTGQWTGLPFVYAVWVVRSSLDPALMDELRAFTRIVARRRARHAAGSRAAVERAGLDRARGRGVPAPLPVPLRSRGTPGLDRYDALLREHGFVESD